MMNGGEPQTSLGSDCYAWRMTVLRLLTGKPLFNESPSGLTVMILVKQARDPLSRGRIRRSFSACIR